MSSFNFGFRYWKYNMFADGGLPPVNPIALCTELGVILHTELGVELEKEF